MKIVIDKAIPFVKGVFEPYCSVEYINGNDITNNKIMDATALLIRTRTHCNAHLLDQTSVQHIATATIGFDHIDAKYCQEHNVEVTTAAGCNARAVLQWFGAVMVHLSSREGWHPSDKTIGVVGVGNVGSLIEKYAKLWGFNVICCDPPRQEKEGGDFVSFEELAQNADIITLHTPLNASTKHIINIDSLRKISPTCTIINSSRGEVVDTQALLQSGNPFVMDVWEDEPNISTEALTRALLATPHIAGYSLQGKANASKIAVRNIACALSLPLLDWRPDVKETLISEIDWRKLCQTINSKFDIEAQSNYLKQHKELFEEIRNNYDYREEYF